jgi:hypothetical protein
VRGHDIPLVFLIGQVYLPKYARWSTPWRFVKNQNYLKSFQWVIVWALMNTSVGLWALNMYFEIDVVFDRAAIGKI